MKYERAASLERGLPVITPYKETTTIMHRSKPPVVLLVEDDPAHAAIIKRNFAEAGTSNFLVHVDNGQAAIDYMRQSKATQETAPKPDLVMLDLRLPKVSGMEVLAGIKSDPDLSETPVVILSTSDTEKDISEAYRRRANGYLVKPFDFAEFSSMIESASRFWLDWNALPEA
jgi:CheY-like chemotaxis protein